MAPPLSPTVAQLAPPLEAPLTANLEVQRRDKKCRKNLVVREKEIEKKKISQTEGLEYTVGNKPEVHLDE